MYQAWTFRYNSLLADRMPGSTKYDERGISSDRNGNIPSPSGISSCLARRYPLPSPPPPLRLTIFF
jgi:hypothetical protein